MKVDLARALLEHAITVTRAQGPQAVSLRDVQRRAGVSNAAAYRHYADRHALLVAVSRRASAAMAEHLEAAVAAHPPASDAASARARLRASGRAYLRFALSEPGLFRAVFLAEADPFDAPSQEASTASGLGPFQVLQQRIDELAASGALEPRHRPFTDVAAWSAVHGLATLLLDGPLARLGEAERQAAAERLLDVVLDGI